MPVTLNATAGDPAANAYISLADAQTYMDTQTVDLTTWTAASADQQNRAIATATRLLDEHVDWKGFVASATQALQWPRLYVPRDRKMLFWPPGTQPFNWWNSFYEDPTTIPPRVANAAAELARQLLLSDRQADDDLSRKQITGIDAGSVKLSFKGYSQPQVLPDTVWYLIEIYGRIRHRSQLSAPLQRC